MVIIGSNSFRLNGRKRWLRVEKEVSILQLTEALMNLSDERQRLSHSGREHVSGAETREVMDLNPAGFFSSSSFLFFLTS